MCHSCAIRKKSLSTNRSAAFASNQQNTILINHLQDIHKGELLPIDQTQNLSNPNKRVVHAEAALIAAEIQGPIGISKLSCGDCYDFAKEQGRASDLRGMHSNRFDTWTNPITGKTRTEKIITDADHFPPDSDSEPEV